MIVLRSGAPDPDLAEVANRARVRARSVYTALGWLSLALVARNFILVS
eukprot:SAG11_NODE_37593_length_256_cov_0.656051_1_plen_47_part_01